jgi:hypothetical protein
MTRLKLTYPHVMSTLAVFLALGGGAWAVGLAPNSVTGKHLAKEAVGGSELKRDAAKGRDVAEETLGTVPSADSAAYAQTADMASSADMAYTADTAYSADIASSADTANTVAPDGVDAAALQDGAVKAGELGGVRVRANDGSLGKGLAFVQVACRPEERLLSGGVFLDADATTAPDAHVIRSSPNPQGDGWQGGVYNGNDTESVNYAVRALCLAG